MKSLNDEYPQLNDDEIMNNIRNTYRQITSGYEQIFVDGVEALSKRTIDLKGSIKSKTALKGVKVENINGAIDINVYICIKRSASVREVAQAVQHNVKDKIQTMTGTAVTRVNVNVQDILIDEAQAN